MVSSGGRRPSHFPPRFTEKDADIGRDMTQPETNLKAIPVTMSDICINIIKAQDATLKSLGVLINTSEENSIPIVGAPPCHQGIPSSGGGILGANILRCRIILDNATEIARHLSSIVGRIGDA